MAHTGRGKPSPPDPDRNEDKEPDVDIGYEDKERFSKRNRTKRWHDKDIDELSIPEGWEKVTMKYLTEPEKDRIPRRVKQEDIETDIIGIWRRENGEETDRGFLPQTTIFVYKVFTDFDERDYYVYERKSVDGRRERIESRKEKASDLGDTKPLNQLLKEVYGYMEDRPKDMRKRE